MLEHLPARAMFRFEFPIHHMAKSPLLDGDIAKWDDKYAAPRLYEIDDDAPFADVYWAWNEHGLIAAFHVYERTGLPQCDTQHWWTKDGLRLCVDTRDARDIRRATRHCRFFYFLPTGGGPRKKSPVVGTHRMSRAKEAAPTIDLSLIKTGVYMDRHSYTMEVAIPAACLTGWDPAEHPRIGIFYKVKDMRLGSQNLTVTDDLGWNMDPSTWATGVLTR